MNSKEISVIVPVYNVAPYLRRCIDSILNQTFKEFELIVIDDGSTDGSSAICDEYLSKDARCRVIHQKNMGLSEARNTGLKNMAPESEFITFIDSDDFIHPNYLEYLFKAIKQGNYKIALGLFDRLTQEDVKSDLPSYVFRTYEVGRDYLFSGIFTKFKDIKYIEGLTDSVAWGRLYHRDAVNSHLFKPILSEDIEFNSRVLLDIETAVVVPQKLYYCVRREGSLSNNPKSSIYYDKGTLARTFEISLENVPEDLQTYRAYALTGLFKAILSTKYSLASNEKEKWKATQRIYTKYRKEFRKNSNIPFKIKWCVLLMCRFTFIYNFYRKVRASTV